MHNRRFASLWLGIWLAGCLCLYAASGVSLRAVDHMLGDPEPDAEEMMKLIGKNSARMLLRHQVSELNRTALRNWERVQFFLGGVLLVILLFETGGERLYMVLGGSLLLVLVIEYFLLTPHLLAVGLSLDFLPAEEPSPARIKYGRFFLAYAVMEAGKMLLLLGIAGRLLMLRQRKRSRKKVKVVDHADHG